MIKVTKQPTWPVREEPVYVLVGTCQNCGCEVEAQEGDCLLGEDFYIKCPILGCFNEIDMEFKE